MRNLVALMLVALVVLGFASLASAENNNVGGVGVTRTSSKLFR